MERAATKLHVVRGLPGDGRLVQVRRFYTSEIECGNLLGHYWIVPDAARLQTVHQHLLNSRRGWVDPGVRTLTQTADAIISGDAAAKQLLPRSASRRLLARVIAIANDKNELPVLGRVSERGGLLDAAEQAIRSAKSYGMTSEGFHAWASQPGRSPKDRELATIFSRYQQRLNACGQADRADRFREARDCLARGSFAAPSLIVLDDFDRLSHDESEFVIHLLRLADKAVVSVLGDENRADVFADPNGLVAHLSAGLGESSVEQHVPPAHPKPSVTPVESLFAHESSASGGGPTISLLQAPNPTDEWRQVAHRVKHWIAVEGCTVDDIVIAAATLPNDRDRAAAVMEEYGLPFSIDAPRAIFCGKLRAVLDLLSLAVQDWPFDLLLRVVGNRLFRHFDSSAPVGSMLPTLRACSEWSIRQLQVARHRTAWQQTLARRTRAFEDDSFDPSEVTPRTWRELATAELMSSLGDTIDMLPAEGSPRQWIDAIQLAISRLGLDLTGDESGWTVVREALLWQEVASSEQDSASWRVADILQIARDTATIQTLGLRAEGVGRIRIVSFAAASRMNCKRLALVGLTEQALGASESAAHLYSSRELARMSGHPSNVERYQQQMLLFYRLATLPSEELLCTYTALDSKAEPVPPCPYLHDLNRALGGRLDAKLAAQPSLKLVRSDHPASPLEFRRLAVTEAIEGKAQRLSGTKQLASGTHLVESLQVVHERSRGESFGPFEGIVLDNEIQQRLTAVFDNTRHWSASQLETYAHCPYKFAAGSILRLQQLGDLSLATNHARRGHLAHQALWKLHEQLVEQELPSPAEIPLDEFLSQYASAVHAVSQTDGIEPVEAALMKIEAAQVTSWGERYHQQSLAYSRRYPTTDFNEAPAAEYLEWRFGQTGRASADESEDHRSTDAPFVLRVGDEEIRFAGRIDRIDVGRVGETTVFNIVDYKSSRELAKLEDVLQGKKLQLPLYAWAVAELLLTENAQPLAAGYWPLRSKKGFDDKTSMVMTKVEAAELHVEAEWAAAEPQVRERVHEIVTSVRRGEFPMQNDDDKCTSRCEVSSICRVAQTRALDKVWPPTRSDETRAPDAPSA